MGILSFFKKGSTKEQAQSQDGNLEIKIAAAGPKSGANKKEKSYPIGNQPYLSIQNRANQLKTLPSTSAPNEEQVLSTSELVFSCVDYISKAASQAVPTVVQVDSKGVSKPVTRKTIKNWLKQPNPFNTWSDTIEQLVQGLLLSGNAYLTFDKGVNTIESWFLGPPSYVSIVPGENTLVDGYIYGVGTSASPQASIAYGVDEVLHFKNPTLNNMYYGLPAIHPLIDTLLLEGNAFEQLKDFYSNSTILSGIIKPEMGLSSKQVEELRTQFNELYSKGGAHHRGVAVLPGKMDFQAIQSNPKDSMLLDSISVSEKRVLRLFKLNALALGGESSSTTHPQELMRSAFNTAVRPYLYKIEAVITAFLQRYENDSYVFKFDLDRIVELETAMDGKAAAAKTLYTTGIASLNEARDKVGLGRLADVEYADQNVMPSYLFGNEVTFYQNIDNPVTIGGDRSQNTDTSASNASGSQDPQGGASNGKPNPDNTSNNQ